MEEEYIAETLTTLLLYSSTPPIFATDPQSTNQIKEVLRCQATLETLIGTDPKCYLVANPEDLLKNLDTRLSNKLNYLLKKQEDVTWEQLFVIIDIILFTCFQYTFKTVDS